MVGKAARFAAILPAAFEGKKHIFLRPAPIQMIYLRIQRMARWPSRGIGVIDVRQKSDLKANAIESSDGEVFQDEIRPAFARADVGELICRLNPRPIHVPERNARQ